MHIEAITTTGGAVLGERPLDAIRLCFLPTLLSANGRTAMKVLYRAAPVRKAARDEWGKLSVLGFWGYDFIGELAETRFAGNVA